MFKNILKIIFNLILLFIFIFSLLENKLVIYAISQAKGQLSIIWNAEPIEKVMADDFFPKSLKEKLILINEIKKFAVDSIGIKPGKNYTTIYNQHDKPLLLVVSACEPFSLKPKEWTFPFLGSVPYKGFFNFNEARKEILSLKEKGYDVDVYSPSGWSTLGWFTDPIQSNMLRQSDGSLANLIIHELTHGTLYVKNNATFNENLASFIGDKGAENFLNFKYGNNSTQFDDYEERKKDEVTFRDYILKSVERLDSLYKAIPADDAMEIKKQKKLKLFMEIVIGVNRLPLYKRKNYFDYSLHTFAEGNSFFMSYKRYDSQYGIFEKEYKEHFKSNLRNYLVYLKEKYPSL